MDAASTPSLGGSGSVNRRHLLQLAGGLGLAAALGACAKSETESLAGSPSPTGRTIVTAEVPQPPVVAPKPVTVVDELCREAWGAAPPLPGGKPHTITRMTLHHTAAVLGDNSNAPGRLRQHQRYHQGEKGWIDIAYHVGIDRNGNVYELRDTGLAGDTATEYDPTGHFLVLCEGDFDQEQITEAQLNGAAQAFAWAAQKFNVPTTTLAGHRDYASTACPGENLYTRLTTGELKKRVDDLMATGTVDLRKICGPEAEQRVQQIEAGL